MRRENFSFHRLASLWSQIASHRGGGISEEGTLMSQQQAAEPKKLSPEDQARVNEQTRKRLLREDPALARLSASQRRARFEHLGIAD